MKLQTNQNENRQLGLSRANRASRIPRLCSCKRSFLRWGMTVPAGEWRRFSAAGCRSPREQLNEGHGTFVSPAFASDEPFTPTVAGTGRSSPVSHFIQLLIFVNMTLMAGDYKTRGIQKST